MRRMTIVFVVLAVAVLGVSATANAYVIPVTFNSCTTNHNAGAGFGSWYASTTSSDSDCVYVDVSQAQMGGDSDTSYPFNATVTRGTRPTTNSAQHAQCGPTTCSLIYSHSINWP